MSSLHVASLIIALLHARLRALRRRVGLSPKVVGIATRDPAFPRWRWWLLAPRLRVGLSPKVMGIATPDPVFCLQPPIPAQVFPCVGFCSGPFSWAFGFLSWAFASFRFRLALSACVFESPVFLPSFRRRCERGAWSVVACFEGKQSVVDLGGVYAQLLNPAGPWRLLAVPGRWWLCSSVRPRCSSSVSPPCCSRTFPWCWSLSSRSSRRCLPAWRCGWGVAWSLFPQQCCPSRSFAPAVSRVVCRDVGPLVSVDCSRPCQSFSLQKCVLCKLQRLRMPLPPPLPPVVVPIEQPAMAGPRVLAVGIWPVRLPLSQSPRSTDKFRVDGTATRP